MAEMIRRKAPAALQRRLQRVPARCAGLGSAHGRGWSIATSSRRTCGSSRRAAGSRSSTSASPASTRGRPHADGRPVGTPAYMAPSRSSGDRSTTGAPLPLGLNRSTNSSPTERPTPARACTSSSTRLRTSGRSRCANSIRPIDPALERIVDKAIEREPDRRYQSLEMMAVRYDGLSQGAGRASGCRCDETIIRRDHLPDPAPAKPD